MPEIIDLIAKFSDVEDQKAMSKSLGMRTASYSLPSVRHHTIYRKSSIGGEGRRQRQKRYPGRRELICTGKLFLK